MMAKNLCLSFLAVAVMSLAATTSYGQILIEDFEGGLGDFFLNDDDGGTVLLGTNANPSGTGDGAWIFDPNPGSFLFVLGTDGVSGSDFVQHQTVTADVTWVASQWTGSDPNTAAAWARWDKMAINSDGGWFEAADAQMTDTENPSFPGSWDPVNWGETHTRTISWDFSSLLAAAPAGTYSAIANSGWFQLRWSTNWDDTAQQNGTFWIDNVRIEGIPEPTSMALLSLSGVFVLLRRRR